MQYAPTKIGDAVGWVRLKASTDPKVGFEKVENGFIIRRK